MFDRAEPPRTSRIKRTRSLFAGISCWYHTVMLKYLPPQVLPLTVIYPHSASEPGTLLATRLPSTTPWVDASHNSHARYHPAFSNLSGIAAVAPFIIISLRVCFSHAVRIGDTFRWQPNQATRPSTSENELTLSSGVCLVVNGDHRCAPRLYMLYISSVSMNFMVPILF